MYGRNTKLQEYVAKYFPGAVKVRFEFCSEYNDENYNNQISYVAGLDKDDNEILPTSGMAYRARQDAKNLPMPSEEMYTTDNYVESTVVGL